MKTGTKVKCIESLESSFLEKGKVYTIVDINQYGNFQVRDDETNKYSAHWYKPVRFEKYIEEKEKIDLSKTYRTKGGSTVKLFLRSDDPHYPIVGQIFNRDNGHWGNDFWDDYGRYHGESSTSNSDLVEREDSIAVKIESEKEDESNEVEVFDDLSMYVCIAGKCGSIDAEGVEKIYNYIKELKGE